MRILVLGAGATGGFYGARLLKAGRDVTFLVREGRAAVIRERGLRVVTPREEFTLQPRLLTADALRAQPESFDLVLLSAKAYSLEDAMEDLAPAVAEGTWILPLLNGMRHIDRLIERFGREHVLAGMCRVVADMDEDGTIRQSTSLSEFAYGTLDGDVSSERVLQLDRMLSGCGFETVLAANGLAVMWRKWWILASLCSICVLGGGASGEVAGVGEAGRRFSQGVLDECTAIVAANGYPVDPETGARETAWLLESRNRLTSSLYRDMTRGRAVEADQILGDLLLRRHEVAAPLVNAAYVRLKVYEASRAQSPGR